MKEFGVHNGSLTMRLMPHCQANKNFAGGKDLVPSSLLCNLPAHLDVSMTATTAVTFWSLTEAFVSSSQSDTGQLPDSDESSGILWGSMF
eukprot:scaffold20268_cov64-Cyclotella_meneghiniana.AAC.7